MPSTVLGTRNTALMAFTFLAGETGRKHLNILVSQVMIRTKIQGRLRGAQRGESEPGRDGGKQCLVSLPNGYVVTCPLTTPVSLAAAL